MVKAKDESSAITKADMIRDAMQELGDSTPKTIQRYVSDKYKMTISTTMISSYKSNFNRKQGRSGRNAGGDGTIGVKDLSLLRDLIDQVGESQLQMLIKVLSKK